MFNKLYNINTTYSELKEYIGYKLGNYPGDISTPNINNIKTHEWSHKDISISEDYLYPIITTCYTSFICNKCNISIGRNIYFDLLTGCSIRIEDDWYPESIKYNWQVPSCSTVIMQQALE
jgi:hypothetical protein